MDKRIENCIEFNDDRSNPSVSEKGKTFQLDNAKSKIVVKCVKIDKCVFDQKDGIKCDYIFEVPSVNKVFYIELKGSDVIHAIEQIHSTLLKTKDHYKDWVFEARIVLGNRAPEVKDRKEYEKLASIIKPKGDIIIRHLDLYKEPYNIWSITT